MLFTASRTKQYFPRYRHPKVAICLVLKKQFDGQNEVSWKALRCRPQWRHSIWELTNEPGFHIHILHFDFVLRSNYTKWKPFSSLSWHSPPMIVILLDHDVIGGSSFLGALRNLNKLFPKLGADFGSYLGKCWSVFVPMKKSALRTIFYVHYVPAL